MSEVLNEAPHIEVNSLFAADQTTSNKKVTNYHRLRGSSILR